MNYEHRLNYIIIIVFQNYAEHTMNELLGLFGYDDKVNSTDTENLNLENYTDNQDDDPSAKDPGEKKSKSVDKLKSRPPNSK